MADRSVRRARAACPRSRPRYSARRMASRRTDASMPAEFLAVHLMVRRVHQEPQRHLEDVVDFAWLMRSSNPGLTRATVGRMRNPKPCRRDRDSRSDRRNRVQPDLFLGFAQCRIQRRGVGGIDLAAGKCDLPGMVVEMRRALRQQDGRLVTIDHRDQHRRRAHRLFLGDDLQHAIGADIAGRRNEAGIGQCRRHLEAQPRAGAIEEFRRTDLRGLGLAHRLVQVAFPHLLGIAPSRRIRRPTSCRTSRGHRPLAPRPCQPDRNRSPASPWPRDPRARADRA